ncbi:MAG: hypothetical protein Q7P63_02685 [Verrucomicrobiota bacterium JB022]|nr:hypothetical protein [Verrucomicrobiota bacterium JB022]
MLRRLFLLLVLFVGMVLYFLGNVGAPVSPLITSDLNMEGQNAYELLRHGRVPIHGGVNSLMSVNPPGVAYGLALGGLFAPHHLGEAERWGGTLMMLATAVCLVLWLRKPLGLGWAALVATLFLLLPTGWFFGFNLWPRAHPLFMVLLLWALDAWARGGKRWAFGAAVLIYFVGCFWMLEFLPTAVLFGVAWVVGWRALPWKPALVGTVLGLAVWSPFLAWEHPRGYADLVSMIGREALPGVQFEAAPVLTRDDVKLVPGTEPNPDEDAGRWFGSQTWGTVWGQTMRKDYEGRLGYWHMWPETGAWFFMAEDGTLYMDGEWQPAPEQFRPELKTVVPPPGTESGQPASKLFDPAVVLETPLVANFQPFGNPWVVWVLFAAFLTGVLLAPLVETRRTLKRERPRDRAWLYLLWTTGAGLALLMVVLASSAESASANYRRLYFLWPAQAVLLVLPWWWLARQLEGKRWRHVALLPVLGLLALGANNVYGRIHIAVFFNQSIPPERSIEVLLARLADELEAEGKETVHLGYEITFNGYQITWHQTLPMVKVGRQHDLALLWMHGIVNTNELPEGLSLDDTYRLREIGNPNGNKLRVQEANPPAFEVMAQEGEWQLLRRVKSPEATEEVEEPEEE